MEKFPNMVGEIPRLREISFFRSPIQGLPTSVEHLIGLESISIIFCEKFRDFPLSISKLPRLRSLKVSFCENFGWFPKSSSSLSLSSSTSSGWLASSKRNKTQDMILSVGFPALETLDFSYCNIAELDFLESLHCFSTLQDLTLSGNNFGSIPACISKFTNWETLDFSHCNLAELDFLESLHCFSTLTYLNLSGNNFISIPACISRFTNLESLDLEDCEGLKQKNASRGGKSFIDNLSMMIPKVYRYCRKMRIRITVRGDQELPEWFTHKSRENEMCFRVPPHKRAKLSGLVIGIVVMNLNLMEMDSTEVKCYVNDQYGTIVFEEWEFEEDMMWLFCVPLEGQGETNVGDYFRVSLEFIDNFDSTVDGDKIHKGFGVHFVFDNTENDDDDDDDLRVLPNTATAEEEDNNCCEPLHMKKKRRINEWIF